MQIRHRRAKTRKVYDQEEKILKLQKYLWVLLIHYPLPFLFLSYLWNTKMCFLLFWRSEKQWIVPYLNSRGLFLLVFFFFFFSLNHGSFSKIERLSTFKDNLPMEQLPKVHILSSLVEKLSFSHKLYCSIMFLPQMTRKVGMHLHPLFSYQPSFDDWVLPQYYWLSIIKR